MPIPDGTKCRERKESVYPTELGDVSWLIYARKRMMFRKTVQAKIVSRIIEEAEEPPIVGASKDTSLMFITAMKDESHSMWKRTELFSVSFDVGGRTRDFYVSRDVFDSLEEGDEGILTYSGNAFIEFNGKKNSFTTSVL